MNKLEEEIEILEEMIENANIEDMDMNNCFGGEHIEALEHILSDYKRVLKENEILKNKLLDTLEGQKVIKEETPQYIKENYISKEKIKDKIKKISEIKGDFAMYIATSERIKALSELLESEE